MLGEEGVDLVGMGGYAENQMARVGQCLGAGIENLAKQFQFGLNRRRRTGVLLEVVAEEELQSQLA